MAHLQASHAAAADPPGWREMGDSFGRSATGGGGDGDGDGDWAVERGMLSELLPHEFKPMAAHPKLERIQEYTEMLEAMAIVTSLINPDAYIAKQVAGEHRRVSSFLTALSKGLATVSAASPALKQRQELQRLYMWFSSTKQQLPTGVLRHLGHARRATSSRALRATYERQHPLNTGSFAVGYLAQSSQLDDGAGNDPGTMVVNAPAASVDGATQSRDEHDGSTLGCIPGVDSLLGGGLLQTRRQMVRARSAPAAVPLHRQAWGASRSAPRGPNAELSVDDFDYALQLEPREEMDIRRINWSADPAARASSARTRPRVGSARGLNARPRTAGPLPFAGASLIGAPIYNPPRQPLLQERLRRGAANATVRIEAPANLDVWGMHFRRAVPIEVDPRNTQLLKMRRRPASGYGWRHDGHYGATYRKTFPKRPASGHPDRRRRPAELLDDLDAGAAARPQTAQSRPQTAPGSVPDPYKINLAHDGSDRLYGFSRSPSKIILHCNGEPAFPEEVESYASGSLRGVGVGVDPEYVDGLPGSNSPRTSRQPPAHGSEAGQQPDGASNADADANGAEGSAKRRRKKEKKSSQGDGELNFGDKWQDTDGVWRDAEDAAGFDGARTGGDGADGAEAGQPAGSASGGGTGVAFGAGDFDLDPALLAEFGVGTPAAATSAGGPRPTADELLAGLETAGASTKPKVGKGGKGKGKGKGGKGRKGRRVPRVDMETLEGGEEGAKGQKVSPYQFHKAFAQQVTARLKRTGIKCKDVSFNSKQLAEFHERKEVMIKLLNKYRLDEAHKPDHLLKVMEVLGHPLMVSEVEEAYRTCVPSAIFNLEETGQAEPLTEMDFVKIVCHFEPPCGVKLLQPRLKSSSWLKPRVAGVDASAFVLQEDVDLGQLKLGGADDSDSSEDGSDD